VTHLDDLLSGYLDGELTGDEDVRVRAHLDDCTQCRHELNEVTKARNLVRSLPLLDAPPGLIPGAATDSPARSWWAAPRWAGAMSAAVVVVLAAGAFFVLRSDDSPQEVSAMATVPVQLDGVTDAIPEGDPTLTEQDRQAAIDSSVDDMGMDTLSDPPALAGFMHEGGGIGVAAGLFDEVVGEPAVPRLRRMYEDQLVFEDPFGSVIFFCDHSWYQLWSLDNDLPPKDAAMALKAALGCPDE